MPIASAGWALLGLAEFPVAFADWLPTQRRGLSSASLRLTWRPVHATTPRAIQPIPCRGGGELGSSARWKAVPTAQPTQRTKHCTAPTGGIGPRLQTRTRVIQVVARVWGLLPAGPLGCKSQSSGGLQSLREWVWLLEIGQARRTNGAARPRPNRPLTRGNSGLLPVFSDFLARRGVPPVAFSRGYR